MDDYYLERAPWYDDRYSVRSIVIEDGVTSVGYAAFFACESAVSVSIADSVTVIEGSAFYSCVSLAEVTIPDDVTSIGDSAFSGCFSITDIIIPDKVESLGDDVFDGCSSLREVYLGSSVSYLGWDVFEGCGSLESVTVSDSNTVYSSDDGVLLGENDTLLMLYPRSKDNVSYTIPSTVRTIENIAFYGNRYLTSVDFGSVEKIGNRAFQKCISLTSVAIHDSVTSVGYQAFCKCTSLREVTIGASVDAIERSVFDGCDSLESITVSASNTKYSSDNGVLLNGDGTLLIQYPLAKKDSAYIVPASVKTIGESAFSGCVNLSSVDFGSAEKIEANAFADCPYLTSLDLSSVKTIGDGAFYQCTSLESIVIPDSTEYVGSNAFYRCTAMSSVTIGKNVQIVDTDAFSNCTFLSSLTVDPGNKHYSSSDNILIETDSGTLVLCAPANPLTSVTIPDTVKAIGPYAFQNCGNLISITIPDSVRSIAHYAFNGCSSLVNITIPSSVTSLGFRLFDGCTSLRSVECGNADDGVLFSKDRTQLQKYPAASTRTSYTVPDGIIAIDTEAFSGAVSLTSVTIPASVVEISGYAFEFCTSLVSINVDPENDVYCSVDGVLFEKDSEGNPTILVAYPGGKSDRSYMVPSTVISVEDAFQGCRYLQSLTVPDSVLIIRQISCCPALKTVHFGSSVLYIGGFDRCPALESITVSQDNLDYVSVDGVLYDKDMTYIHTVPAAKTGTLEISAGITDILVGSLSGGNSLTTFKVAEGNEEFASVDGVLFTKDMKTLLMYPGAKEGAYIIPEGIEKIGSYAFVKCRLTSLTFADSVRTVSENAIIGEVSMFGLDIPGCSSLEKMVFNSGLRFVDGDSFVNLRFGDGCGTIPVSSANLAGRSFIRNGDGDMVVETTEDTYAAEFMIAIATVMLLACIGTVLVWRRKNRIHSSRCSI